MGALLGLQRQVATSVLQTLAAALRSAGGLVVLLFVSRTIEAYFVWQVLLAGAQTAVTGVVLWHGLPRAGRPIFRWRVLRENFRFSAGMAGIAILGMVLTQVDKVVVSRILSLEAFGYYTLAGSACSALYFLIGPVFMAMYPKLTQLVKLGDLEGLSRTYHGAAQLMTVSLIPAAAVLALFAPELLLAWTGDPVIVANTRYVVAALAVGTALNGLMNMPYAVQLAYGWTRLTMWTNVVSVVVLVPLTYVLANRWGANGAALGWAILNAGYILFGIHFMHRRVLSGEKSSWYLGDVLMPTLGALIPVICARLLLSGGFGGRAATLAVLGAIGALSLIGAGLAAPFVRRTVLGALSPSVTA